MLNINDTPINFRVIGFGRDTEDAITQLRELGYNKLTAEVFNPEQPPCVTSDDMMIILLVNNQYEDAVKVSESFKKAGVLTLSFCAEGIEMPIGCADSQTKVSVSNMYAVANTILDVLFAPSVTSLGFIDIDALLRNSGTFNLYEGVGFGENRVQNALVQLNSEGILSSYKKDIVCIYENPDSTQRILMSDIEILADFINEDSDNSDLFWGLFNDRTLGDGVVRISLITTTSIR